MDLAKAGADALQATQYDVAITKYTEALRHLPAAVPYYIARSTAYQRSSPPQLDAALKDGEIAVNLATKRAKRELIAEAQLRRAITLFALGKYADAGYVFGLVKRLKPDEKVLPMWEMKVNGKLKQLPDDDEARKVTAVEVPDVEIPDTKNDAGQKAIVSQQKPAAPARGEVQQTPADKIKHDFYQTSENIHFTLLAKGVPKDDALVEIHERSISISFPTASSSTFHFSLDPLYGPVDPQQSSFVITPSKVELTLKKATPGMRWPTMETSETAAPTPLPSATASSSVCSTTKSAAPSYPTSSRSGPKDWDKLADDLTKKKDAEKDGKDEDGDEWDDEDGGDPANAFFKKLYKSADPDTRRAMMKSYQESNGTALSTNWSEVGKAPVETSPPDGMVAKKWGE